MTKPIKKLTNMEIDEISLVDKGGNQWADVVISKRLEDDEIEKMNPGSADLTTQMTLDERKRRRREGIFGKALSFSNKKLFGQPQQMQPQVPGYQQNPMGQMGQQMPQQGYSMPPGGQPPQQQGMTPQQQQSFQQQGEVSNPFDRSRDENPITGQGENDLGQRNPLTPPSMGVGQPESGQEQNSFPDMPQDVQQYIRQLEDQVARLRGHQGAEQMPFGKSYEDEVSELYEFTKSLGDDVTDTREAIYKALDLVALAEERAVEAEEIAKAEREVRETSEFVEYVSKAFPNVPVDPTELGIVMKNLYEVLPEDQLDVIEAALRASNDIVGTSGVFDEFGKSEVGWDYTEIDDEVGAEARELVNKGLAGTDAEAQALIYEHNPHLYDEYLAEKGW